MKKQNKNAAPVPGLSGTGNPTCCAQLAPRQGGDGYKNAASGAGLSGTGPLSAAPDWPPARGGDGHKKCSPAGRPERNRPLICCARLPPARGAMGAFFNPAIQPEKTKMQPRGPAYAEPVTLPAAPDWPPVRGAMGTKNAAPRAGLCGTGAGLLRRKEKDEGKKEGDALKKIRTGDQKDRSYCSAVTLTLPSAAKEMPSADWGV